MNLKKIVSEKLLSRRENIKLYSEGRSAKSVACANLPLSVLVEVTSKCNLSCRMCNIHHNNRSGIDISQKLLEITYILAEVANLIHSYGLGEALIRKDIVEIVGNYKLKGAFVSIVTNGMLLKEDISRGFVEKSLDSLALSIDSANEKIFKDIRRGADLNIIKKNIKVLNEIKKSKNKNKPDLAMNVVIQKSNFYELADIIRLAKELGIYYVTFSPITTHEHISEIQDEAITPETLDWQGVLKRCFQEGERNNITINAERLYCILNGLFPEDFYKDKVPCPEPFRFFGIRANGDVYPCCNWDVNSPLENIEGIDSVGDIIKIWRSERWKELREAVIKNNYPEICRKCMNNFTRPFYDDCYSN